MINKNDVLYSTNKLLDLNLSDSQIEIIKNHLDFCLGDFYKIFEYRSNHGLLATLFHSYPHPDLETQKIRHIITNRWIKSTNELVCDGSKARSTEYISGWHLFSDYSECMSYLKKFTADRNLGVVKVKARGLFRKEHSRNNVWLAEEIFVDSHEEVKVILNKKQ